MAGPRTSRGLDRLVNFSDATVAIAITLLILPLVDLATELGTHPLGELIVGHSDSLISFFITFAVIGRFWSLHHRVFEYARSYSPSLVWMNLLWLCSIVFLPFAANLLAISIHETTVYGIYIGTMIVSTLALGAVEWVMLHDPELLDPETVGSLSLFQSGLAAGLLTVGLVGAVFVPGVGMYGLLVLLLAGPITRDRERRAKAAKAQGAVRERD